MSRTRLTRNYTKHMICSILLDLEFFTKISITALYEIFCCHKRHTMQLFISSSFWSSLDFLLPRLKSAKIDTKCDLSRCSIIGVCYKASCQFPKFNNQIYYNSDLQICSAIKKTLDCQPSVYIYIFLKFPFKFLVFSAK